MMVNVGNLIRGICFFFFSIPSNEARRPRNFFPSFFFFPPLPILRATRALSSDDNRLGTITAARRDPRVINSAPKGTFGRLQRRCRKSRNHGVRFRNDWLRNVFSRLRVCFTRQKCRMWRVFHNCDFIVKIFFSSYQSFLFTVKGYRNIFDTIAKREIKINFTFT